MTKAIYPGSFDPITKGHIDIIERSAKIFTHVYVVLMRNPHKQSLFSEEERLAMMIHCCQHLENVTCTIGSGLSIKYAKSVQANVMIRGIRAVQDYEYELRNATANMWMDASIETCFLLAKPEYSFLSSSTVKEIASFHEDVSMFVDPHVKIQLLNKFR